MTSYSLPTRIATISLMVAISFVSLLGFSMVIELKPAQAFFGIDAAITIAFEFVKALAKQFVLTFVMRFILKALQKLESIHIIRNIMHYMDSLGADQYIGNWLSKQFNKPKTKEDATKLEDPLENNTSALSTQLNTSALSKLDPSAVKKLAQENSSRIDTMELSVSPTRIKAGQEASLSWSVTGDNIVIKITADVDNKGQQVPITDGQISNGGSPFVGSLNVRPLSKSIVYYLNVFQPTSGSNDTLIGQQTVVLEVEGQPLSQYTPPAPINKKLTGINSDEARQLTKLGVAALTQQVACGGVNAKAVANVAIFNAARAIGFNTAILDPSSPKYYGQILQHGNPFASRDFNMLILQDTAQVAESESRRAVQTELTSNGTKSLRSPDGRGLSRTSQTIAAQIEEGFGSALGITSEGSNVAFLGQVIGKFLANMVVDAIFKEKGRVVAENPFCGIANLAVGTVFDGLDSNADAASKNANPAITVNGQSAVLVHAGDQVTLAWEVQSPAGTVSVTNVPAGCGGNTPTGSCTFVAQTDKSYELQVTAEGSTQRLGIAFVRIDPNIVLAFNADKTNISRGERVVLSWETTANNVTLKLDGVNVPNQGTRAVNPQATTIYSLRAYGSSSPQNLIATQEVTVVVGSGSITGQSDAGEEFKIEPLRIRE